MKHVTALYRTRADAEAARDKVVAMGAEPDGVRVVSGTTTDLDALGLNESEMATYREALGRGDALLVASVDDEMGELAQAAMRDPAGGPDDAELRARADDEGQLIAPAGKPLAAVGATSTIGAADDGRQTYQDPMEPRE